MKNKILNVEITSEEQRNELVKQLKEMEFKKELPKSWEELIEITGYWVDDDSDINKKLWSGVCLKIDKNIFKTEKQAKKALAMAQLSQLMAVYNDGWEPDWGDEVSCKYTIQRDSSNIVTDIWRHGYKFLAFKSREIRDEFLKNFKPLIRQFFELD